MATESDLRLIVADINYAKMVGWQSAVETLQRWLAGRGANQRDG